MESEAFEKTQGYLAHLLGYLEGLYASMDWEAGEAAVPADASAHGLPPRPARLLADSGYLEGLRLKAQGCLSSELQEFIRAISYAFELEVRSRGAFKLPFVAHEMVLQRKTLNDFMERAWLVYHGALLSAYALKPLRFEKIPPGAGEDLEDVVRVIEAAPGAGAAGEVPPESLHQLNNALAGIISYVSLVLAERKSDADLQQKLGLVLEAAHRLVPGRSAKET